MVVVVRCVTKWQTRDHFNNYWLLHCNFPQEHRPRKGCVIITNQIVPVNTLSLFWFHDHPVVVHAQLWYILLTRIGVKVARKGRIEPWQKAWKR